MAFSDANASLLSKLGEAMNDQNEQINVCLEALEKDPNDKESFERLVDILQQGNHVRTLVDLYEKFPHFADWKGLIELLVKSVENEENVEKKSGVFHVCGQICEMKLQSPDKALQFYKLALKTWPKRTESLTASRNIYKAMGNYKMVFQLPIAL